MSNEFILKFIPIEKRKRAFASIVWSPTWQTYCIEVQIRSIALCNTFQVIDSNGDLTYLRSKYILIVFDWPKGFAKLARIFFLQTYKVSTTTEQFPRILVSTYMHFWVIFNKPLVIFCCYIDESSSFTYARQIFRTNQYWKIKSNGFFCWKCWKKCHFLAFSCIFARKSSNKLWILSPYHICFLPTLVKYLKSYHIYYDLHFTYVLMHTRLTKTEPK